MDETEGCLHKQKANFVILSHIMVGGDGRSLGHCGSDIVCVGFSWNDRGGGGGWRKIYIPHHTLLHFPPLEHHLRRYINNTHNSTKLLVLSLDLVCL